jgi:type VI secretion system protein ImpJ
VLPQRQGLVYFQINRSEQPAEWDAVRHSLTLAIRLNENLITGDIQGQRTLKINFGGQQLALQFMLFVAQPAAGN